MDNISVNYNLKKLTIKLKNTNYEFSNILAVSSQFVESIRKACLYSDNSNLICLTGESGVGKEIIFKIINKIFGSTKEVVVNCGAINENLLESELFGHRKGSFTSAISDRKGAFLEAGSGVLFLDEIGELSLKAQVKLLRALEYNEIKPVGSDLSIKHRAKVVLATNRDLTEMVAKGMFRKDLFYRIETYMVKIPSLRERKEEIESLAKFFFGKEYCITKSALNYMKNYSWPGNIRELKNAVLRAKLNSKYGETSVTWDMFGIVEHNDYSDMSNCSLHKMEEKLVKNVYFSTNKNISKASQILGIPRTTLYSKLRRFNVSLT